MVAVLRNADQIIKTYAEQEDFEILPGETLETIPISFSEYAARLRISAVGRSGETLHLPAGTPSVEIQVICPGEESIILEINNEEVPLSLVDGAGCFQLTLLDGQAHVIRPRDRIRFCAAGEALMTVIAGQS